MLPQYKQCIIGLCYTPQVNLDGCRKQPVQRLTSLTPIQSSGQRPWCMAGSLSRGIASGSPYIHQACLPCCTALCRCSGRAPCGGS